jgi:hypothetical protein
LKLDLINAANFSSLAILLKVLALLSLNREERTRRADFLDISLQPYESQTGILSISSPVTDRKVSEQPRLL